jgi:hypothetical protein
VSAVPGEALTIGAGRGTPACAPRQYSRRLSRSAGAAGSDPCGAAYPLIRPPKTARRRSLSSQGPRRAVLGVAAAVVGRSGAGCYRNAGIDRATPQVQMIAQSRPARHVPGVGCRVCCLLPGGHQGGCVQIGASWCRCRAQVGPRGCGRPYCGMWRGGRRRCGELRTCSSSGRGDGRVTGPSPEEAIPVVSARRRELPRW